MFFFFALHSSFFMKKRSVKIMGHFTSVTLEDEFWSELKILADAQKLSLNALIAQIDKDRKGNLSSALRLYILKKIKEN